MIRFLTTLFVCHFLLLLPGPAGAAISPAGEGLVLFFSNDVRGETAPCG